MLVDAEVEGAAEAVDEVAELVVLVEVDVTLVEELVVETTVEDELAVVDVVVVVVFRARTLTLVVPLLAALSESPP